MVSKNVGSMICCCKVLKSRLPQMRRRLTLWFLRSASAMHQRAHDALECEALG